MQHSFRIAVIATEYRAESHADVIVSRWLRFIPTDADYGWNPAKTVISSMYVDQIPQNDLSEKLCAEYAIPRFETIADALTLGGPTLAVNGVLIIGEHGDYPENEFGQKLYPRKKLFDKVLEVFHRNGRSVPVFFDKHFSWNMHWAHEMYWTIRKENIPFFGGSSLTYSPFSSSMEISDGAIFDEVVAVYYRSLEHYLFHSIEIVQSLIERRRGGEVGIASVIAWKNAEVWEALEQGKISMQLLEAAVKSVSSEALNELQKIFKDKKVPIIAFQFIYRDGLKVTHIMQDVVSKWAVACQLQSPERIMAAFVQLEGVSKFFPHFALLNRRIEDFFLSGKSPIPLERLYLTTQATANSMRALADPGKMRFTPEMAIPVPEQL